MMKDLMRNQSTLNFKELVTILNKLNDILSVSVVTPDLGQALINIVSNILESDSKLGPFTNTYEREVDSKIHVTPQSSSNVCKHFVFICRILNITEEVGDKMVGYEGSYTLSARAVALTVVDVVPGQFNSLSFGVLSDWNGNKPEVAKHPS